MKKFFPLILLSAATFFVNAQSTHSCCTAPSATDAFASLGKDVAFQNAHEAPIPLEYNAMGRMITFPTPDGKSGKAYFVPAHKQTKNYIFVFHEWWGLNDWIKKEAGMLADSVPNSNVIAVDLYDGQVATTSDEAGKYMQANDAERSKAIIKGALNYAGKNAKVATIGWCFGGGWSMQGALLAGTNEAGCVMYYGMPESDVNKLKTLNSGVLFMWAKKDQWINEKVKSDFEANMKQAGKELTVHEYDADHAFANPSNPHYDKASTTDSMKYTLAYFRKLFANP